MGKSKITIVGAGLSGMVAGINLVREGYEIEIWDGAKSIGQLEPFHPSVHTTPADVKKLSDYIGIDVGPAFVPVRRLVRYVENQGYELNGSTFQMVERGGRKTSLDHYLYTICKDCGIKFRFNTLIRRLEDVPERAIVATGMYREGMEAMGISYMEITGYYCRKKLDDARFENCSVLWTGKFTTDYAYLSVINNLMFFLVFARGQFTEEQGKATQAHLRDTVGLEFSDWHFHRGHILLLDSRSLRLFKGNRILAGTISGMIDPFAMFGIHGGLISGRIAAWAVTDKEKALKEFQRQNRNFKRVRIFSSNLRQMPFQLQLSNLKFTYPRLMKPLIKLTDGGIPGYGRYYAEDALVGCKKLKRTNAFQ